VALFSYPASQLSEVPPSEQNMQLELALMKLSNLFLLMRVQLIVVQLTEVELGQYVARKPHVRLSSVEADGEFSCFSFIICSANYIFSSFSVLPALCLDGILHVDIVEGAFNTESFYEFINRLLDQMQPYPASNSVIVMDNCRIHKHPMILDLIRARYVDVYIHNIFF
jgi:hypothetical protein